MNTTRQNTAWDITTALQTLHDFIHDQESWNLCRASTLFRTTWSAHRPSIRRHARQFLLTTTRVPRPINNDLLVTHRVGTILLFQLNGTDHESHQSARNIRIQFLLHEIKRMSTNIAALD